MDLRLTFAACLRHAFMTGAGYGDLDKITEVDQFRWVEYDPSELASFKKMDAALTPTPQSKMVGIDPRTGRPIGDHGTALQAIDWVLNKGGSDARCEMEVFLKNWMEGNLDEWPEFYAWLSATAKEGE